MSEHKEDLQEILNEINQFGYFTEKPKPVVQVQESLENFKESLWKQLKSNFPFLMRNTQYSEMDFLISEFNLRNKLTMKQNIRDLLTYLNTKNNSQLKQKVEKDLATKHEILDAINLFNQYSNPQPEMKIEVKEPITPKPPINVFEVKQQEENPQFDFDTETNQVQSKEDLKPLSFEELIEQRKKESFSIAQEFQEKNPNSKKESLQQIENEINELEKTLQQQQSQQSQQSQQVQQQQSQQVNEESQEIEEESQENEEESQENDEQESQEIEEESQENEEEFQEDEEESQEIE